MYWVKTPWFLKKIFKNYTWDKSQENRVVYLTFDDGPIPEVTEWIVELLNQFNVKATFFCVGENVMRYPDVFKQLIDKGHCIGNHTNNHNNGWYTDDRVYLDSVKKTQQLIEDTTVAEVQKIFRPPYGKITPRQSDMVRAEGYDVIMWDILSADFDQYISPKKCLRNVLQNTTNGSIVVFHDNVKSFKTLQYVLPKYLKYLKKSGFEFGTIY